MKMENETESCCVVPGQRGAIYLVNGFRGDFIKNVSFARVAGNCR